MDMPIPHQDPIPEMDFAAARDRMVDGQVRPNKVIDPRVIRAMRTLPRERFLPPALASLAYADEDVPLPGGRALMEPMVIARLAQLARVRDGDRVLVVGAGPGYGAALLSACGGAVTALEQDEALLAIARAILPQTAPAVVLKAGPLAEGVPGAWDVIMIEGAVREIPPAIALLLNPQGGRLVTVLAQGRGMRPGVGSGVLAEPLRPGEPNAVLRARAEFDCATPLLPAFLTRPEFRF